MASLEERIKAFVRAQGVAVVGVAGPERLDGPPSLDLNYSMPGGRSIISMALPIANLLPLVRPSERRPSVYQNDRTKAQSKILSVPVPSRRTSPRRQQTGGSPVARHLRSPTPSSVPVSSSKR